MPILQAASPVEIEAKADVLGLSAPARSAALALFHDLTSREELTALTLPSAPGAAHDGSRWPAHCLLAGAPADLAPVLAALRARPDAAELAGPAIPEGAVPGTLFLHAELDGAAGILIACSSVNLLDEVAQEVMPPQP